MLTDWTHWLSSLHRDEVLAVFIGLLVLDGPRYALSKILLMFWDFGVAVWHWLRGTASSRGYTHCPSVCVLLPGYNEAETIGATLRGLWGTYPRLEIVVIDDGSEDSMFQVAYEFAKTHPGVLVLRRPERGGKSSAMNFGLQYTKAEIVVVIDADSTLGPSAIWEIVQPLEDPQVGAVSGTVVARNPFVNLVTWLQAYEYLCCIFIGRLLSARLGILGIVSGAFGAFRRLAIEQGKGWDVGPPEDMDVTLRVRKAGYRIAHAPYASCLTDLPTSWWGLFRQRRRWDQSGVVRNHCRKHLDMASFWSPNFSFPNFFVLLESWLFSIFCLYAAVGYTIWLCFSYGGDVWKILFSLYLAYLFCELIQVLSVLFYTRDLGRDALLCIVFPLMPLYQVFLMVVRLLAFNEELFFKRSYEDNFVPRRVREATWHW